MEKEIKEIIFRIKNIEKHIKPKFAETIILPLTIAIIGILVTCTQIYIQHRNFIYKASMEERARRDKLDLEKADFENTLKLEYIKIVYNDITSHDTEKGEIALSVLESLGSKVPIEKVIKNIIETNKDILDDKQKKRFAAVTTKINKIQETISIWNGQWELTWTNSKGEITGPGHMNLKADQDGRILGSFKIGKINGSLHGKLSKDALFFNGTWENIKNQKGSLIMELDKSKTPYEYSGNYSMSIFEIPIKNSPLKWYGIKKN